MSNLKYFKDIHTQDVSILVGNVNVGANALNNNITGEKNVAIGINSLSSNTVANNNVAIGWNSMQTFNRTLNTVGNNTAIGSSSLRYAVSASLNISIGEKSMHYHLNGNNNVAIGVNTLQAYGSPNYNIAIGSGSLALCTGDYNVVIGHGLLTNIVSGANNVAIGKTITTANNNDSSNICIGNTSSTDGNSNICIGNNSTSSQGSLSIGHTITNSVVNTMLFGMNEKMFRLTPRIPSVIVNIGDPFPTANSTVFYFEYQINSPASFTINNAYVKSTSVILFCPTILGQSYPTVTITWADGAININNTGNVLITIAGTIMVMYPN